MPPQIFARKYLSTNWCYPVTTLKPEYAGWLREQCGGGFKPTWHRLCQHRGAVTEAGEHTISTERLVCTETAMRIPRTPQSTAAPPMPASTLEAYKKVIARYERIVLSSEIDRYKKVIASEKLPASEKFSITRKRKLYD